MVETFNTWGPWACIAYGVLAVCVKQTGGVSHQKQLMELDSWLTPAAKRKRAKAELPAVSWLHSISRFWPLVLIIAGVVWLVR